MGAVHGNFILLHANRDESLNTDQKEMHSIFDQIL